MYVNLQIYFSLSELARAALPCLLWRICRPFFVASSIAQTTNWHDNFSSVRDIWRTSYALRTDICCLRNKHLSFCVAALPGSVRTGAVNRSDARNCTKNHSNLYRWVCLVPFTIFLVGSLRCWSAISHRTYNWIWWSSICIRLKQCVLKWLCWQHRVATTPRPCNGVEALVTHLTTRTVRAVQRM